MGKIRTLVHYLTLGIVDSNEEVVRKNTPCRFDEYLSFENFQKLAIDVAKPIKRLFVTVDGHFVHGEVRTVSGANSWTFKLDFNDFGKVTGNYWFSYIENADSTIPSLYAKQLGFAIERFRKETKADKSVLICNDFVCPNCSADLALQRGFSSDFDSYICKSCGQQLFNPYIYSGDKHEDVYWYCDRCNALLNKQKGFNDRCRFFHCSECGYKNEISENNIE